MRVAATTQIDCCRALCMSSRAGAGRWARRPVEEEGRRAAPLRAGLFEFPR